MSQEPLNLRRSVQILRRYKILVGGVVTAGMLAGVGYAVLHPPMLTSKTMVVVSTAKPSISTEVLIASSQPVLSGAAQRLGARVPLSTLVNAVTVTEVTPNVLSISAASKTAALAESESKAIADSYIAFVGSPGSPVGQVSANILVSASPATGTGPIENLATVGLIGGLAGLFVGFLLALRFSRGDRRLRERDEIAKSIGVPVIAAIRSTAPADGEGWLALFDGYQPDAVDGWRLRSVLDRLDGTRASATNGSRSHSVALTVLSLASDRKAFALGPQLAVFAASLGIPTSLLIAPQDTVATAALRAVCTQRLSRAVLRGGQLQVGMDDSGEWPPEARLTIVVAAVGAENPRVSELIHTPLVLLAVSAGSVSAQQLARAAAAGADAGSAVAGILVADPDPNDTTTGLVPRPVLRAGTNMPSKHVIGRKASNGDRPVAAERASHRRG